MKRRNLGVIARRAAAMALSGGALLAAVGTASATTTGPATLESVSDCRDYVARWGLDDTSVAERDAWWACRVGAHPELSSSTCGELMYWAIEEHNASHPYRYVEHWVGWEACHRAD